MILSGPSVRLRRPLSLCDLDRKFDCSGSTICLASKICLSTCFFCKIQLIHLLLNFDMRACHRMKGRWPLMESCDVRCDRRHDQSTKWLNSVMPAPNQSKSCPQNFLEITSSNKLRLQKFMVSRTSSGRGFRLQLGDRNLLKFDFSSV